MERHHSLWTVTHNCIVSDGSQLHFIIITITSSFIIYNAYILLCIIRFLVKGVLPLHGRGRRCFHAAMLSFLCFFPLITRSGLIQVHMVGPECLREFLRRFWGLQSLSPSLIAMMPAVLLCQFSLLCTFSMQQCTDAVYSALWYQSVEKNTQRSRRLRPRSERVGGKQKLCLNSECLTHCVFKPIPSILVWTRSGVATLLQANPANCVVVLQYYSYFRSGVWRKLWEGW